MMHTVKVIAGGLVLLAVCLLVGRSLGGATPTVGLVTAAKVFVPLWLVAAGINMWLGVSKAGYSVADEAPIFLVVFAVPAASRSWSCGGSRGARRPRDPSLRGERSPLDGAATCSVSRQTSTT
jgi:hypothetical protein